MGFAMAPLTFPDPPPPPLGPHIGLDVWFLDLLGFSSILTNYTVELMSHLIASLLCFLVSWLIVGATILRAFAGMLSDPVAFDASSILRL